MDKLECEKPQKTPFQKARESWKDNSLFYKIYCWIFNIKKKEVKDNG